MIRSLYIKNFALVAEVYVEFKAGLNIITGETGAGKSIVINALSQISGERGSPELVRSAEKKAIIEAVVSAPRSDNFKQLLTQLEIEESETGDLILRKEINANGSARIFINDSPSTLNRLNELCSHLFDLHGQHQHQRLLHQENHIYYLDDFASIGPLVSDFEKNLKAYRAIAQHISETRDKQHNAYQTQDMYRYQNEELTKANLDTEEYEELKAELKKVSNIEHLNQFGEEVSQLLYSGDVNASKLVVDSEVQLRRLSELDNQFKPLLDSLGSAREALEEVGRFTERYLSNLQFDPDRMDFIHTRISQLDFLLKKYQKLTIADLIELHEQIKDEIKNIDDFDEIIEKLKKEADDLRNLLVSVGTELSLKRRQAAEELSKQIVKTLHEIGMASAKLNIDQELNTKSGTGFNLNGTETQPNNRGFDIVTFEIAANSGEQFKPLNKVASGGEISRVMLALKSVLAEADAVPSLVFDEIDSGISGKIAQIVGRKLAELSTYHQILCVTHLPQIAAFAQSHFRVEKTSDQGNTFVQVVALEADERLEELAILLGGESVSSQARENARQLMEEATI